MLNMDTQNLDFAVPELQSKQWYIVVDTAQGSPADSADPGQERAFSGSRYSLEGRAIVILLAK